MNFLALSLLTLSIFSGGIASADTQKIDLKKDFSSLGDNDAVVQRAQALNPNNKYKVVQSRIVDRNMRLEMGLNYGLLSGGDPYVSTQNLGANLDFHINPSFSIGARYYHSYNSLTSQGQAMYDSNAATGQSNFPAIDYVSDTTLGEISWYPIYGKLAALGVTHFDLYLLGGYGVSSLVSGPAGTLALGGGVGFWFTQHLTARLEGRFQEYNDHPYVDTPQSYTRQVNEGVYMVSVGFLL